MYCSLVLRVNDFTPVLDRIGISTAARMAELNRVNKQLKTQSRDLLHLGQLVQRRMRLPTGRG